MHGHDPPFPMAEQTDEDQDIGLTDAADGGVHVEMPPAEEELPQVVGEKVYRRRGDKKHIGCSWNYWDNDGHESLICHCKLHDPPCKKRTTARKNPSWNGGLRWIAAGAGMTRGDHLDAYERMVLPAEFRSKPK